MKTFQNRALRWLLSAHITVIFIPVHAQSSTGLQNLDIKPMLDLRIRQESAQQSGFADDASSSTLRHRLGLAFSGSYGLSGLLETESVVSLLDQNYNSGPGGNGRVQYPVVADPVGNQLNQAYVDWKATTGARFRVGRQRIIHDKARFVGNVGWRQNEQTFDAAALSWSSASIFEGSYSYLQQINRIFFDAMDVDAHLIRFRAKAHPAIAFVGYAYLLDTKLGEDSQTLGLRASGSTPFQGVKLSYTLEYARQQDYADSSGIDNSYRLIETGATHRGFNVVAGFEVLGGDGSRGFSTPLATLHAYNGWADKFLATPAEGLEDGYLKLGYTHKRSKGKWKLLAVYHDFHSNRGSSHYGSEVDFLASYKLTKQASFTLKYADYTAGSFASDTQRLIGQVDFKL